MNTITMKLNADDLILMALKEDISSEDVTTNAIMRGPKPGTAQLNCKQDGIIPGMDVFTRVFELLDEATVVNKFVADGDEVTVPDNCWRKSHRRYPGNPFGRAHRAEFLAAYERYCNVYK